MTITVRLAEDDAAEMNEIIIYLNGVKQNVGLEPATTIAEAIRFCIKAGHRIAHPPVKSKK